jgi:hypothetical protein
LLPVHIQVLTLGNAGRRINLGNHAAFGIVDKVQRLVGGRVGLDHALAECIVRVLTQRYGWADLQGAVVLFLQTPRRHHYFYPPKTNAKGMGNEITVTKNKTPTKT